MLTVRTVVHSKSLRNKLIFNSIAHQSTNSTQIQSVTGNSQDNYEKQLKTFETITNVTKRTRIKKPNRPPFAKNLFLGKFDKEILTYPQLEKEDSDLLEKEASALKKLMQQSHMVDCKSLSDKLFRQSLSDYKAIGLQAPQLMDARGCNVTESFRYLEILGEHNLAQSIVNHEQLGVQTLVTFADNKLKLKYLHPIIKGEALTAFCINESESSDIVSFKTKAKLAEDQKNWVSTYYNT